MRKKKSTSSTKKEKNRTQHISNKIKKDNVDLKASEKNKEELRPNKATINLPDVKDIPGQEHIHVPPLGMLSDTTISSNDEEGENVFNKDKNIDKNTETNADVSKIEKRLLKQASEYMPDEEEDNLNKASLDDTDFEGEKLNEKGFGEEERSGEDLDVPEEKDITIESEDDDEENNYYSLGGDDNEVDEDKV